MVELIKNKYVIVYFTLYAVVVVLLTAVENYPLEEIIFLFVIIGVLFSSIAYILSKSSPQLFKDTEIQNKEVNLVVMLIFYFVLFITFYKSLLDLLIPNHLLENALFHDVIIGTTKLIFIVVIPIAIYKVVHKFSLLDWGFLINVRTLFSKKQLIIFFVFSCIFLLFQFYVGNGAKPIREGLLSSKQLMIGLPLCYLWIFITVGLVEEFFFRCFLQSRLSLLLNSKIGGIILSSLIFGIAHAPGIYLRGGGVIANLGAEPSLLMSIGYSIVVLSVAGFFLGIIYLKTKNIWLVIAIHTMVDLLPQLNEFVRIWGID